MNMRETAWRIFSKEFNAATLDIRSQEEKSPSYVVTQLGARVNRLFVVGVVTETDNIGTGDSPMIRARLADPAGNYYISAGQFQQSAMDALRELKPPEFVAVVGKARVYAPDDDVRLLSVRPETVMRCDAAMRDYWIYETCLSTLKRVEIMREATQMDSPSEEELIKLGYSRLLAEGAVAAANHYDNVDLDSFEELVRDSLRDIVAAGTGAIGDVAVEDGIVSLDAEEIEVSPIEEMTISQDEEETVMKIIDSLDRDSKGAVWKEMVSEAKKRKMDKDRLEEICADLLDKGDIYEPELGRMKRI